MNFSEVVMMGSGWNINQTKHSFWSQLADDDLFESKDKYQWKTDLQADFGSLMDCYVNGVKWLRSIIFYF